jgi:hypothetical protein
MWGLRHWDGGPATDPDSDIPHTDLNLKNFCMALIQNATTITDSGITFFENLKQ